MVIEVFAAITAVTLPIGRIVSELMLFLLYFGVVTPIALLARLGGRNRLHRELDAIDRLGLSDVLYSFRARAHVLRAALAEGADGYKVVYALPEFDTDFTDGLILIADRKDGELLPPKEGPLRMVVPWEKRQARWIRQLTVLRLGQAR
jgi:hypothetical protein